MRMVKELTFVLFTVVATSVLTGVPASAAKYVTESVESNPSYNFLSQRLTRIEIEEGEEIDLEELSRNIFVPSKNKSALAKSFPGVMEAEFDLKAKGFFEEYELVYKNRDYQYSPVGLIASGVKKSDVDNLPSVMDNYGSVKVKEWTSLSSESTFLDDILKAQDSGVGTTRVNAALAIPIDYYNLEDSIMLIDIARGTVYAERYAPIDPDRKITGICLSSVHYGNKEDCKNIVDGLSVKEFFNKFYVNHNDMTAVFAETVDNDRSSPAWRSAAFLVFEEFDIVVKPKAIENDVVSSEVEEVSSQESGSNSVLAPNTGFNSGAAWILLGITFTALVTASIVFKK